jgi:hypothetical protein
MSVYTELTFAYRLFILTIIDNTVKGGHCYFEVVLGLLDTQRSLELLKMIF